MPPALKDLLIACCLTLAGVTAGLLLAGSAQAALAELPPECAATGAGVIEK